MNKLKINIKNCMILNSVLVEQGAFKAEKCLHDLNRNENMFLGV